MTSTEAPYITDQRLVFHYTSAATALEHILKTGMLRLGPISETNDPGDPPPFPEVRSREGNGDPGVRPFLEAAMGFHEAGGNHKLGCFALDSEESITVAKDGVSSKFGWARDRMWAQYADHHRGICIAFDRARLEAAAKGIGADANKKIVLGTVSYTDDVQYPLWNIDRVEGGETRRRYVEWLEQMLPAHFFTKRKDWVAEAEYRILLLDFSGDGNPYAYFHAADAVRFVFVGAKFSDVYRPCVQEVCERLRVPAFRYELTGRKAGLSLYCSNG